MRVSMIAAITLCGRISPAGMGSPGDRRFLEAQRHATDASLIGAGTLRAADAQLRGPGGSLPPHRLRAVISATGNLPVEGRTIFQEGPPPCIFTAAEAAPVLARRVGRRAEVVALPLCGQELSLRHLLDELAARGAVSLLIEGGGRLNYAALRQGVVDELLVTITPKLLGATGAATLADGPVPLGAPFRDLTLLACDQAPTGELFCRYQVHPSRT
ncbi:MAG TPA: RibD family protein [Desulfurivibrionaceae bacterium]|nr:RibD family protein [Desulfurivibrionaceae bacterium]